MNFLDIISKKIISNFIQILPVGDEIFHADRQTYITKLSVAFRNFANKPKTLKLRNWITLNQKILRIKIRILIKNLSAKLTQGFCTVLAIVPAGKRAKTLSHYLWKSCVTHSVQYSKAE